MKAKLLELGKDSLIYGVGSVISRSIGLISLPLFTAYLTPEEFGILALLAILTMAAQPIFSLGLSAAMGPSYFSGDNRKKKSETVWTAFSISLVSSTVLIAIAWIFPYQLALLIRVPSEHSLVVALALTGCALNVMATAFSQRVQFEKQAKRYVCISVTSAFSAIAVSALTVVYLDWGILGMVAGQILSAALNFLLFGLYSINQTIFNVSRKMARELLRTGLPLVPSFAFLFLLMNSNKYFLEMFEGLDAVGLYSVGFSIGAAISVVTSGVAQAWYPFFISYINKQNEVGDLFGWVLTYYVYGVGYLCVLFFLFAEPVVTLLVSQEFHNSYTIVGIIATAYFVQTFFNLLLPGIYFNKDVKVISFLQGGALLCSIPAYIFLINYFGMIGAALSLVLGNAFMVFFTLFWNKFNKSRYVKINYQNGKVYSSFIVYIFWVVFSLKINDWLQTEGFLLPFFESIFLFILVVFFLFKYPKEISFFVNYK